VNIHYEEIFPQEPAMALKNLAADDVLAALREFDDIGREAMLERYCGDPGGKSKHWYILHDGKLYDQQVALRAAHELAGLGPLPQGRGLSGSREAKRVLTKLGFRVGGAKLGAETPSPTPDGRGRPCPPFRGITLFPARHDPEDSAKEHGQ